MERLLEDFDRPFALTPLATTETRLSGYIPRVDVVESESDVKVTAELPGMEEKEIDVSLFENQLTIRGEKKAEQEEKGETHFRVERTFGSFGRIIELPCAVADDKVEASFKKGLLTIRLPKTVEAKRQTRKIDVTSD
ncbi:MAG TPA: Hsp20/alpha crystallin family protein [Bdellovibrionota bacterium]|nr:Hsp20/alpha crystallin family protein [Bdellovibrionota bacterium]